MLDRMAVIRNLESLTDIHYNYIVEGTSSLFVKPVARLLRF